MSMRFLLILLIIALPFPALSNTSSPPHPLRPEPVAASKGPQEQRRVRSLRQEESLERTRRCGAEWQGLKAKGATAGKTWATFSRACRDRLKASGQ